MDADTAFLVLKLVHTAITLFNTAAVGWILWCGLTGRSGPFLNVALIAILLEGAALVAFGFICRLQLLARHLKGVDTWVDDLFLPHWFAAHVVQVSLPFALAGFALVLRNHLRRRRALAGRRADKGRFRPN